MEFLANVPYDLRAQYGHLIVLGLESEEEKSEPLRRALDMAGYPYLYFPLSEHAMSRSEYFKEICAALDRCACLIPVFGDTFWLPESQYLRNLMWFAVGYVRAVAAGACIPLLLSENRGALSGSPLKNANILFDHEQVLETLRARYHSKLLKNNYYRDYQVNLYASRRIMYRRIAMKFRIYESAYRYVTDILSESYGSNIYRRFDHFLEQNLSCGCKIISFGCDNAVEPQLEPFRQEMHPDISELPQVLLGKTSYDLLEAKERDITGVHAEYRCEVLVPVHKLFGVYLKPYLKLKDADLFGILAPLFAPDLFSFDITTAPAQADFEDLSFWKQAYPSSMFINEEKRRLYFTFDFEDTTNRKRLQPTPEMGLGTQADYIFPQ